MFLVATREYYVKTKSRRGLLFSTGLNNPMVDLMLQCNVSFAPNTDPDHLRLKLFTRSFETRGTSGTCVVIIKGLCSSKGQKPAEFADKGFEMRGAYFL